MAVTEVFPNTLISLLVAGLLLGAVCAPAQAQTAAERQAAARVDAAARRAAALEASQQRRAAAQARRDQAEQDRATACDRLQQWIEGTSIPPHRATPDGRMSDAEVLPLLQDDRFRVLFGTPYEATDMNRITQWKLATVGHCFGSTGPLWRMDPWKKSAANEALNPYQRERFISLLHSQQEGAQLLAQMSEELRKLPVSEQGNQRLAEIEKQASPHLALASEEQQRAFKAELSAAKQRVAAPIRQAHIQKAVAGAQGYDGLVQLVAEAKRSSSPELRAKISSLAAGLAQDEKRKIDALGSGLAGLAAGVQWSGAFRQKYESMLGDVPELKGVNDYFLTSRNALLQQSSAQATTQLAAARTPQELSSSVQRYLLGTDAQNQAGASILRVAVQRSHDLTKWAILQSGPERDRATAGNLRGEPTEGEMYDAYDAHLAGVAANVQAMADTCKHLENATSADAMVCLLGGAAAQGGAAEQMRITQFEKAGCGPDAGIFLCSFKVALSGGMINSQVLGGTLAGMAGQASLARARFYKSKQGWVMQPLEEDN
jgi:hypothetical protein